MILFVCQNDNNKKAQKWEKWKRGDELFWKYSLLLLLPWCLVVLGAMPAEEVARGTECGGAHLQECGCASKRDLREV